MAIIGYARVSKPDQSLDLQIDAIAIRDLERIFSEKMTGTTAARPELAAMLEYVRAGDVLVIESLSCLGRSTSYLIVTVQALQSRGVDLISPKKNSDATTPCGRFVLVIFAALAELETMPQRSREGAVAANNRGDIFRRPQTEKPKRFDQFVSRWKEGEFTATEAHRMLGLSRSTFYRMWSRPSSRRPTPPSRRPQGVHHPVHAGVSHRHGQPVAAGHGEPPARLCRLLSRPGALIKRSHHLIRAVPQHRDEEPVAVGHLAPSVRLGSHSRYPVIPSCEAVTRSGSLRLRDEVRPKRRPDVRGGQQRALSGELQGLPSLTTLTGHSSGRFTKSQRPEF